jgi:hypothetical protein
MKTILLITISLFLASCSGVDTAVRTSDNPNCTSVVEGSFQSKTIYDGKVPVLIFNKSTKDGASIYGKILSVTNEGVMFDQDRISPFVDPEPKLFPLDQIACVIDSNEIVVYGTIPNRKAMVWNMDIIMNRNDDTTQKPLKFELTAGEKFSFCVPPGKYSAKEIYFNHGEDIDEGVLIPVFSFVVSPQKVNYIGELRLDVDSANTTGVSLVPYKMRHRSSSGWGAMFGLVGGIAEVLTTDYGIQGGHRLRILRDEHYVTSIPLPLEFPIITFEPNPLMPKTIEKK